MIICLKIKLYLIIIKDIITFPPSFQFIPLSQRGRARFYALALLVSSLQLFLATGKRMEREVKLGRKGGIPLFE